MTKRKKVPRELHREEKGSATREQSVISFRVQQSLREELDQEALEAGLSLGEYIRLIVEERGEEVYGKQEELPFPEEEDPAASLEEFLDQVSRSARGLARGWVVAKLVPKLSSARKRADDQVDE